MEIIHVASIGLLLSLTLNVFLAFKLKKKPTKSESYEVTQLLHDLTAGDGLVRVSRVAPVDVLIRSPRQ